MKYRKSIRTPPESSEDSPSLKVWKFPTLGFPAQNHMTTAVNHMIRLRSIWVMWPSSPLNRELSEYPDWLLLIDGVSVLILGKAGSLSALWLEAAVSLTDQEIPVDTSMTGNHPITNQISAFSKGVTNEENVGVLLPTGSPLQLTLSTSSSSSSSSTSRRILFTACRDSFNC